MRKVLFGIIIGLFHTVVISAQMNDLNGTWEIVSAEINLIQGGTSQLVHTLTKSEIESKSIPETITMADKQLDTLVQKKKMQSSFSLEKGWAGQTITHEKYEFTMWLSGENQLILVAEYDDGDFKGNELRLTYHRK
jgi:hypothetical protein